VEVFEELVRRGEHVVQPDREVGREPDVAPGDHRDHIVGVDGAQERDACTHVPALGQRAQLALERPPADHHEPRHAKHPHGGDQVLEPAPRDIPAGVDEEELAAAAHPGQRARGRIGDRPLRRTVHDNDRRGNAVPLDERVAA